MVCRSADCREVRTLLVRLQLVSVLDRRKLKRSHCWQREAESAATKRNSILRNSWGPQLLWSKLLLCLRFLCRHLIVEPEGSRFTCRGSWTDLQNVKPKRTSGVHWTDVCSVLASWQWIITLEQAWFLKSFCCSTFGSGVSISAAKQRPWDEAATCD